MEKLTERDWKVKEVKMKTIKDFITILKGKVLNRWFFTGLLIMVFLFILVLLYIIKYKPFAFIYSAF